MSKNSEALIAGYRRDNLNKLAVFLSNNSAEAACTVVPALASGRTEWPQSATAALQIEKLAEPVLAELGNIGWRLANGEQVPPDWLRSLRHRVRRYHNVKV